MGFNLGCHTSSHQRRKRYHRNQHLRIQSSIHAFRGAFLTMVHGCLRIEIAPGRSGLTPGFITVWESVRGGDAISAKTNRRLYCDAEIKRLRMFGLAARPGLAHRMHSNYHRTAPPSRGGPGTPILRQGFLRKQDREPRFGHSCHLVSRSRCFVGDTRLTSR